MARFLIEGEISPGRAVVAASIIEVLFADLLIVRPRQGSTFGLHLDFGQLRSVPAKQQVIISYPLFLWAK